MCIIIIKTGAEQYSNRVYTSDFFYAPGKRGEMSIPLNAYKTYTPHEVVICGLNGVFGRWEIGHVLMRTGQRIYAIFTRKILSYDPHRDHKVTHKMINCTFEITSNMENKYVLTFWGFNGGKDSTQLLHGGFKLIEEQRESYPIGMALSELPF